MKAKIINIAMVTCVAAIIVLSVGVPRISPLHEVKRVYPPSLTYTGPSQLIVENSPFTQRDLREHGVIADFNADGINDWVRTFEDDEGRFCQFLSGVAEMQFAPPVVAISREIIQFCPDQVAELTGDGVPDLIYKDIFGNGIKIFRGNGDGTFTLIFSPTEPSDFLRPESISVLVADFNRDGRTDFATVSSLIGSATSSQKTDFFLFLADPTSKHFMQAYRESIGFGMQLAKVGDINCDGLPDVVISTEASLVQSAVLIAFNDGGSSFSFAQPYDPSDQQRISIVDVNKDGCDDVLTFSPQPIYEDPPNVFSKVTIDFGAANPNSSTRQHLDTAYSVFVSDVGFFDLDSKLDTFGPDGSLFDINSYSIRYGNGEVRQFHLPPGYVYIVPKFQDISGDGIPDVFATGEVVGTYTVYGFFSWLSRVSFPGPHASNSAGAVLTMR